MTASSQSPGLYPLEAAQKQRSALLRAFRMVFLALYITVTLLSILSIFPSLGAQGDPAASQLATAWPLILAAACLFASSVILFDIFTPNKKISTLVSVFLGLLAGMLGTLAVGAVIDLLVVTYGIKNADALISVVKVLVGICLAYLGISTVLQTQDDFRLVLPYVEFSKQMRGPKPLILDTSILIDARIVDLASTGLVQAPVVIPHFVVSELQQLADSSDKMKRVKGRRGLDVIGRLQRAAVLDVSIDETPLVGKSVDQLLVELARRMPGTVVTADSALARIAQIQGVTVLNLNDVANALKPALIPGEQITVRIIKPGEQPGQGVGYLDDGTMIVVEHAADRVGLDVQAEVTSSLQTSAGRLIFARMLGPTGGSGGWGSASGEYRAMATAGAPGPAPAPTLPAAAPTSSAPMPSDSGITPASESNGHGVAPASADASGAPVGDGAHGPAGARPANGQSHREPGGSGAPITIDGGSAAARDENDGSRAGRAGPYPPKPPSRTPSGRNPRR